MPDYDCIVDGPRDIEPRRRESYKAFRARILEQGGFTVFYACDSDRNAQQCTRLLNDPTLVVARAQFPNYSVKRREELETKPFDPGSIRVPRRYSKPKKEAPDA